VLPLDASKILIVDGVEDDPKMRARMERLRTGISAPEVCRVDDAQLNAEVGELMAHCRGRHGMHSDIRPVVIFNRFRLDDSEEERKRRIEAYPELCGLRFNGYSGFDWRESGSLAWRKKMGLVCQPAWQVHTIVGCHFRCAYCNLGWFVNILLNIEDFIDHLDQNIAEHCPKQTLFQWDNYTDAPCFEPEYGASKLFVEYFAKRPGQALELYVGKSDHVDYLLDYDHQGHTVCCWSLSSQTQSTAFEPGSAPMAARIASIRKCQDAGYPVRVRLSPIIPVRNWESENREMLQQLFAEVDPDVVTIETIRFLDYAAMEESFDLSLLDDAFVQAMKDNAGGEWLQGCEVPDGYRKRVYDLVIGEIERLSPKTPYAFCRESSSMWANYQEGFARHGQNADRYLCNCAAHCAPATAGALA